MEQDEEHDIGDGHDEEGEYEQASPPKQRQLPADLPRSLDDRQNFPSYSQEQEYYDGWAGKS